MANSDYTVRSLTLTFCPRAVVPASIGRLDTSIVISNFSSPFPNGIKVGGAAMINNEIVSIVNQSGNTLTIGRGCCDTVPAAHAANSVIWFFDEAIGSDGIDYGATASIGVKVLPRTSVNVVPIEGSPPQPLTFSWRFFRPYPPGLVRVNGQPWFTVVDMQIGTEELAITWAHRDRVTQQDVLIDHMQASIGPEPGVSYRLEVRKADNTLVRSEVRTVASWSYSWFQARSDFATTSGQHAGYILLTAVRDALDSFQNYRIDFTFDGAGPPQPFGLGYRLGEKLGGY